MEELRLHEERGPFVNMPGMTEEKFDSLRFKEREGNKYHSRSFRGSFGSKTKPISIRFTNIGIAKMTWPRLIHLIATHHSMQFLQPGMYYLLWHKRLVFLLLCCIPKNMPNFLRMSILVDFLHPYPFGTDINWGLKELFGDKMHVGDKYISLEPGSGSDGKRVAFWKTTHTDGTISYQRTVQATSVHASKEGTPIASTESRIS